MECLYAIMFILCRELQRQYVINFIKSYAEQKTVFGYSAFLSESITVADKRFMTFMRNINFKTFSLFC